MIAKLEQAAGEGAAAVSTQVAVEVDATPDALPRVQRGAAARRRLSLRYYVPGRDEVTQREVDPMRLVVVDGRTYLEGWCYRAEAVRLFRLDRMLGVEVLDVAADPPAEAEPDRRAPGVFRPSPTDELVELELTAAGPLGGGVLPVRGGRPSWARAGCGWRCGPATRAGWSRLALRLGDTGRVVSPASLAERVRAAATSALNRYESVS